MTRSPLVALVHDKSVKAWPAYDRLDLEVVHLNDALNTRFKQDTHVVSYVCASVGEKQPRLRKTIPDRYPSVPTTQVLFADIDNPGHRRWDPGEAEACARDVALETEGFYTTSSGFRLVQPLVETVSSYEVENMTRAWYASLERRGFDVDWHGEPWNWLFRLPYVTRAGKPTEPIVSWTAMRPITIVGEPELPKLTAKK